MMGSDVCVCHDVGCCVRVTGKVMLHRLTRLGIKCVFVTLNLASFYIRKVSRSPLFWLPALFVVVVLSLSSHSSVIVVIISLISSLLWLSL